MNFVHKRLEKGPLFVKTRKMSSVSRRLLNILCPWKSFKKASIRPILLSRKPVKYLKDLCRASCIEGL